MNSLQAYSQNIARVSNNGGPVSLSWSGLHAAYITLEIWCVCSHYVNIGQHGESLRENAIMNLDIDEQSAIEWRVIAGIQQKQEIKDLWHI